MTVEAANTGVTEKALPISGLQVQWRAGDRCFRVRHPDPGHIMTEACEDELLWRQWSGRADMAVGVSGALPEAGPDAGWWVVWGEYIGDAVTVDLPDGTTPPVATIGGLWISEWSGPEQTAIVTTAQLRTEVRFAPPSYLSPPFATASEDTRRRWARVETPATFRARDLQPAPKSERDSDERR